MTQTKIQKIFAVIALFAIAFTNLSGTASATQIGTGSVSGTGAFDTVIDWDDSFPGSAVGSLSGIIIKARVLPILDMTISTGTIDLGDLTSGVAATGSLFIEVGTNAKDGVVITARSASGGLAQGSGTGASYINDDTQTGFTDGVAESYTWASTVATVDDSNVGSFAATGLSTTEINENSTEHTVYSTNKPEADSTSGSGIDDVEFIVSATSEDDTAAGNYTDYVTFTVTGTF